MKHMRIAKASGCLRRWAVFPTAAWRSQDWKDSSGMTQALCLDMWDQGLQLNIQFESKVTRRVTHFLEGVISPTGYYGVLLVYTNSVIKYVWICTTKSLDFDFISENTLQSLMQEVSLKSEILEIRGKTSNLNAGFNFFSHYWTNND